MTGSANTAIDWEGGVSNAWTRVATFVPTLVAFLLIVLLGFLVAKILARVTDTVLERVGFDRAVERGGIKQALSRSKYDASDIVAKLVYYAVVLIALVWAFSLWGTNPVSTLLASLVAWLPHLAIAIVIVVLAAAIARAVKDIVSSLLGGLSYGATLANIASIVILGLGIIAALDEAGIATTVTTPVLVAILATVGGILVVGVGGGLVRPMQQRWDRWLASAERETATVREHVARQRAQAAAGPRPVPAADPTVGQPQSPSPGQPLR